ncbi:hypothetical protein ACIRST_21710 [Kitasatospora sp. NPDC101447]|uniref:hypothetical protein n=1 Tax=Kitasatospora sp. NPDC101447 TaxID=3364102 RepID=UPI003800478D
MSTTVFPIVEAFDQPAPRHKWTLLGTARITDGLELTSDEGQQMGAAVLEESFRSTADVVIDFDFMTGTLSATGAAGNGFCCYLFDASAKTTPGAHGPALGYSFLHRGGTKEPGVSKGYVGIGFDNSGDFATEQAGEGAMQDPQPGLVGVRGPGDLHEGFPWLIGTQVPGGFHGGWQDGLRARIALIAGQLTVTLFGNAHPKGVVVIDRVGLATELPTSFKLGFSAGTGTARAVHRIRNLRVSLPVEVPLLLSGPETSAWGDTVHYTATVVNRGPNDCPDVIVKGRFPAHVHGLHLVCTCSGRATNGKGTVHGRDFSQPVSLPAPGNGPESTATITLQCTIDDDYLGDDVLCTASVGTASCTNTAEKTTDSVRTTVVETTITPTYRQIQSWQDGQVYVITYEITLAAVERKVTWWRLWFGGLPEHSGLHNKQDLWVKVNNDGFDGKDVDLESPPNSTIKEGDPLTLRLQVGYPSKEAAGEGELTGLRAHERQVGPE